MLTHIRPLCKWFTQKLDTCMKFLPANRLISLDAIKTESPFALSRRYPSRCDIFCHIGKHYPPIIAHTGSCAKPKSSTQLRISLF